VLPELKPRMIIAARKIKRMLTGNLIQKVITHPSFPGTEKELLRAQIARISSDNMLCISSFLKEDEDNEGAIIPNETYGTEPPLPNTIERKGWTHMYPHILATGRTTHKEIPEEVEDDEENAKLRKKMMAEREGDPEKKLIRGLNADGLEWVIKQAGDTALYQMQTSSPADPTKPPPGPQCNAVTYVRSLSWPGAVAAARGSQFANLYIGYSLPANEPDFFIPAPPNVQDEPIDPGEQPEPQGSLETEAEEKAED